MLEKKHSLKKEIFPVFLMGCFFILIHSLALIVTETFEEAGMQALQEKLEDFEVVEFKHFEYALTKVGSTLQKETIDKYETLAKQLAQDQKVKDSDSNLYQ